MRKTIFFISIALLSRLVLGQSTFSGKVLDEQGNPLPGATIVLNNGAHMAMSANDGSFKIYGLPSQQYTVSINFVGLRPFSAKVRIPQTEPFLARMQPDVELLHEVVVTDNYYEVRKRQESSNIEIVNQQFIEQNLSGSLMQSLNRLPGVSSFDIGAGISKPVLRGLSFNRVVVAENGVKHEAQQWGADHGLEIDQHGVSEVEIVKGAASLKYGSDAIGGIVNLKNTVLPQPNSYGGSLNLNTQSINGLWGSSLFVYGRKQFLYFNARATWSDYADYRVPVSTVNIYSFKAQLKDKRMRNTAGEEGGLTATFGIKREKLHTFLHLSFYRSKTGFFANAHGLEPRKVNTALHDADFRDIQLPFQQVHHFKANYFAGVESGNHALSLDVGWQLNIRQERGPYTNHGFMPDSLPLELNIPQTLERAFDKQTFTINFKDEIKIGKHQLTAGLQSEYQHNKIDGWNFIIPDYQQWNGGVFLYDKWVVNERLIGHLGVRYDVGNLKTEPYTDWFQTPVELNGDTIYQFLQRAGEINKYFGALSYGGGVNYNRDHFEWKAYVGKSFRMPIAKELAADGVNYHHFSYEVGNPQLHPEESYQIDFSGEVHYALWALQVSPFFNYFPNYIYLNPTSDFDFENGAGNQVFQYEESSVVRFGGEVHGHYKFTEKLKLGLIGEYLYAEQRSGAKAGYTLPFSSPPTLLVNLKYSRNLNANISDAFVSLDFKYTARQNRIVPPEKITPAYGLINFSLGTKLKWNKQWLHLNFRINNLLNHKYLNHTSYYRLIDLPEPGINFLGSVKILFNLKSNE